MQRKKKNDKKIKTEQKTQHKKTKDCVTRTLTKTEVDLRKVIRYCCTRKVLIPGKVYLSRIWHNILEFWVLNAFRHFTCLAL